MSAESKAKDFYFCKSYYILEGSLTCMAQQCASQTYCQLDIVRMAKSRQMTHACYAVCMGNVTKYIKIQSEDMKRKDYLEALCNNGWLIQKYILQIQCGRVWTGFDSGKGLMVGSYEYRMEPEWSLNVRSFFVLAQQLTMAQVGQFSTELSFKN